eukprot:6490966-Amphidinium_carterae.3
MLLGSLEFKWLQCSKFKDKVYTNLFGRYRSSKIFKVTIDIHNLKKYFKKINLPPTKHDNIFECTFGCIGFKIFWLETHDSMSPKQATWHCDRIPYWYRETFEALPSTMS